MSAWSRGRFNGRFGDAARAVAVGGLVVGLSACSGGSDETASPSDTSAASDTATPSATSGSAASALASAVSPAPASSPASAGPAADTVITISVKGRTVTPAPGRRTVSVGDRVQLVVTTDTANTLHVHGVEIEKDTTPGVPLTVNFTVKDPGVYSVELHKPELLLVQLVVR